MKTIILLIRADKSLPKNDFYKNLLTTYFIKQLIVNVFYVPGNIGKWKSLK